VHGAARSAEAEPAARAGRHTVESSEGRGITGQDIPQLSEGINRIQRGKQVCFFGFSLLALRASALTPPLAGPY
jgi:hypothetical protein